ncbi:MAG: Bug family tripartite tricarboxylate transporter substrate binding protein, partial [Betaproteobacteria bacterium]
MLHPCFNYPATRWRSACASFALLLAACGISTSAMAQAAGKFDGYPNRPIRNIVPFTTGSATDVIARIIGPRMSDFLGQQIVVDNRPSAGGVVAFKIVADAAPDGYTLTTTGSNFSGSAALYHGKLPYDPVKDFTGIAQIASTPLVLVVGHGLGVKSVKELVALAKSKPGQLNFGSTGHGSGPHYAAALFNLRAGVEAVHVPFRGSPESLTDTVTGRVHYLLSPVLAAAPLISGGRLIALGVTTKTRAPGMPNVPSVSEVGLPTFEYEGWYGLLAPAKTPPKLISLWSNEMKRILDMPDVQKAIASRGAAAKWSTPEQFTRLAREEIATRMKVWKAAGVKIE